METWRIIPSSPDYSASSLGNIRRDIPSDRNPNCSPLKLTAATSGYMVVNTRQSVRYVHALVCEAFHGTKPTAKHEVAHFDGDRANNAATNLRWVTRAENMRDMIRHGRTQRGRQTAITRYGSDNYASKLTEADVYAIRLSRESQAKIAERFGVTQPTVSEIRNRRKWRHI